MMTTPSVKIDARKLLGFRLELAASAARLGSKDQLLKTGAMVGEKTGGAVGGKPRFG